MFCRCLPFALLTRWHPPTARRYNARRERRRRSRMPTRKTVTLHAVQRRGWLCYDEYCFRIEDAVGEDYESADEVGPSYPLSSLWMTSRVNNFSLTHTGIAVMKERHPSGATPR